MRLAKRIALTVIAGVMTFAALADGGTVPAAAGKKAVPQGTAASAAEVTFVELGSVNCVPCRMMQPVMESVAKKYGGRVKVVFHDVWTAEGRPYGKQYRVRAIPTQVFLDRGGREFFRHEGYFPQEEIEKVLKTRGVQ